MSTETQSAALKMPSVKLPRSVQEKIQKGKDMEKALIAEWNKSTPDGNHSNPPSVINPAPTSTQTQEPVTPVVPVIENQPVVEQRPEDTAKYWEHRFKTSAGIFNAEKAKQNTLIGELKDQVEELRSQMKNSQRQSPSTVDLKQHFSETEIETYGPDVLQAVHKTASIAADQSADRRVKEELDKRLTPIRQELDTAKSDLRAKSENLFWDSVNRSVPNWMTVNADSKFLDWLGHKDPVSGFVRQDILTNAQNGLDSERVTALFTAFMKDSPASQPAPVNVNREVVPEPNGQTNVVTNTANSEAPIVFRAEIKKYYSDKAMGMYRNRPQAAEAMEKKILAAQKAGTIR